MVSCRQLVYVARVVLMVLRSRNFARRGLKPDGLLYLHM